MINTTIAAAEDQQVFVVETDPAGWVEHDAVDAVGTIDAVEFATEPSRSQRGMVSAEWAVGIIAAIAIAGVLLSIVVSGPVKSALLKVILSIIKMFTQNAHFLNL